MMKPYSMDLRERVVAAVKREGLPRQAAARRFGAAPSTSINRVKRLEDTGSVAAGRCGGCRPKKIAGAQDDWLRWRCRDAAFTIRGLVLELAERGLKVSYRVVWILFAPKTSPIKTMHAAEQDRPDLARRRALWKNIRGWLIPADWFSSMKPGP